MPYSDTTTFLFGGRTLAAPRARLTSDADAVLAASVSAGWQTFPGNVYTFTYAFPDNWRGTVEVLDNTTATGVGAGVNPPVAGGGPFTGDGDTLVDHNTGGADALRVVDPLGVAVDNAEILAYRRADYDSGIYTLRDRSITRSDGRWARPCSLNPAVQYTLLVRKTGSIASATINVTPI